MGWNICKKIIDHLGYAAANGSPIIEHKKASNTFKNLQKEAKGIEINEVLHKAVKNVGLTSKTMKKCYF